ncbi:MAG: hypothetical protein OEY33_05095 [Bdellovibrionales bacterium]|jgi:hypothetical protein|nr:hypothetical protein [Bdellovibrionales bacterium]
MKIVYILVLLLSFSVAASSESEDNRGMQELRLAKAELALSQGKDRFALYLVGRNLSQKNFHLDSYLFLASYYLKERRVAKAFRVYHYVIKKLHPKGGKRLLRAANVATVKMEFETVNRPSDEALAIYYTLGQTYVDIEEKGYFSQKFTRQLLLNAKKYFTITNHYDFQKSDSNFFLGSVNSRLEKYGEAISNLTMAKELYEDEENTGEQRSTEIQNINFLLADALIKEGHTDSGAIFLKSLYLSPGVSSSLKEYANSYLDALSTVYKIVTISLGYTYDNNVNQLSDEDRENFDELRGFYVAEDALFFTKNFNYFYSSEKKGRFSYVFFVDATEQTVNDERKYSLENRVLTLASTLKWETVHHLIFKTSYSFTRLFNKESRQGGFNRDSDLHEISPELVWSTNSGTVGLKVPITYEIKKGESLSLSKKGVNFNFNPFWKNPYITPTFNLSYNLYEDPSTDEQSKQTVFSASNHLVFIKNLSAFLTFSYGTFTTTETINYNKEIIWNLDFSYVFKKYDNFSATYRFSSSDKRKESGDEIDNIQHIFKLSINF